MIHVKDVPYTIGRRDPSQQGHEVRQKATHVRACSACGNVRPSLYRYGVLKDNETMPVWAIGQFCNKACWARVRQPDGLPDGR